MIRTLFHSRYGGSLPSWGTTGEERHHVIGEERREAFRPLGCRRGRMFFAHRIHYVPRIGPDALLLAERMARVRDPDALWLVTVHALGRALDDLPAELFRDDDIVWHRQALGIAGHVAYAMVAESGGTVHVLNAVSDLVQRSSRAPAFRSRVRNRFGGWATVMLNAVLHFARLRGARRVRWPTADWVLAHTDPARQPGRELFERVYDSTPGHGWVASRSRRWWELPVPENLSRMVAAEPRAEARRSGRTLCVMHDVERGLGHLDVDPAFAHQAETRGWDFVERMLDVEREAGVRATYAVVGKLLPALRDRVEAGGHEIAFHSFDHGRGRQLQRCRAVDYRVEGYRPPRSRLTWEVRGRALRRLHFQWLASSEPSLRTRVPVLRRRVAMVPILADDFPLHTGAATYDAWEKGVVGAVEKRPFSAVSLHDCYAPHWIERYPRLLERLGACATIRTVGEVVAELFRQEAL